MERKNHEGLSLLAQIQICRPEDNRVQYQLINKLIEEGGSNDQLIDAMARATSPENLRLAFSGLKRPLLEGHERILLSILRRASLPDLREQVEVLAGASEDSLASAVA